MLLQIEPLFLGVGNGSGLPGCGPGWNGPRGPGPGQEPPSNPNPVTIAGLLPGPDIYPLVFGRVGTGPPFQNCGSYNFGCNYVFEF